MKTNFRRGKQSKQNDSYRIKVNNSLPSICGSYDLEKDF